MLSILVSYFWLTLLSTDKSGKNWTRSFARGWRWTPWCKFKWWRKNVSQHGEASSVLRTPFAWYLPSSSFFFFFRVLRCRRPTQLLSSESCAPWAKVARRKVRSHNLRLFNPLPTHAWASSDGHSPLLASRTPSFSLSFLAAEVLGCCVSLVEWGRRNGGGERGRGGRVRHPDSTENFSHDGFGLSLFVVNADWLDSHLQAERSWLETQLLF